MGGGREQTMSYNITKIIDMLEEIVSVDGRATMKKIIDEVRGPGKSNCVDCYEFDGMDTLATYLLSRIKPMTFKERVEALAICGMTPEEITDYIISVEGPRVSFKH